MLVQLGWGPSTTRPPSSVVNGCVKGTESAGCFGFTAPGLAFDHQLRAADLLGIIQRADEEHRPVTLLDRGEREVRHLHADIGALGRPGEPAQAHQVRARTLAAHRRVQKRPEIQAEGGGAALVRQRQVHHARDRAASRAAGCAASTAGRRCAPACSRASRAPHRERRGALLVDDHRALGEGPEALVQRIDPVDAHVRASVAVALQRQHPGPSSRHRVRRPQRRNAASTRGGRRPAHHRARAAPAAVVLDRRRGDAHLVERVGHEAARAARRGCRALEVQVRGRRAPGAPAS